MNTKAASLIFALMVTLCQLVVAQSTLASQASGRKYLCVLLTPNRRTEMTTPVPFPIQQAEPITIIELPGEYDPLLQMRPATTIVDLTITGTSTGTGGHNDVDDDSDSDK